jgi:hypothetical protein
MTELLQKAISAIQQLPIEQQNAMVEDRSEVIDSRFLAKIQDEKAWEERFQATTDAQWDNLAAMVRQEINAVGRL